MTQLITRLFADEQTAKSVASRLIGEGFPRYMVRVVRGSDDAGMIKTRLLRDDVAEKTADAYVSKMPEGGAVLVVRASYKPLGAALIARDILGEQDTVSIGKTDEEIKVKDWKRYSLSILPDHPRLLTMAPVEGEHRGGPVTASMFRLLSKPKERTSAIKGGKHMSRAFWPMPLVKSKRKANSAIKGGKHMSRAFWPMALVSDSGRSNSVIPGGDRPFSRMFGLPTIIRR